MQVEALTLTLAGLWLLFEYQQLVSPLPQGLGGPWDSRGKSHSASELI